MWDLETIQRMNVDPEFAATLVGGLSLVDGKRLREVEAQLETALTEKEQLRASNRQLRAELEKRTRRSVKRRRLQEAA